MKYRIEFTDTAKSDLRNIAVYIAEQTKDKETAKKFVKELSERCLPLEDFPQMGAVPKDRILVSYGYRFIVHNEYLIFYSADEPKKTVYIQAIFNAKKDYMRVFKRIT